MTNEKYIISSCAISNGIVLKNSVQFFVSDKSELHFFLLDAYRFLSIDYPKFYKMDNLSKLGFLTSEILLLNERLQEYQPEKTALIFSNANASLDADEKYFQSTKTAASPALFVYTLPNIVMGEICIRNKFKGENAFFIAENFDIKFIYQYVNNLFNNSIVDACICGWVDVLDENYKAVLFLVTTKKQEPLLLFTEDNMSTVFKSV